MVKYRGKIKTEQRESKQAKKKVKEYQAKKKYWNDKALKAKTSSVKDSYHQMAKYAEDQGKKFSELDTIHQKEIKKLRGLK